MRANVTQKELNRQKALQKPSNKSVLAKSASKQQPLTSFFTLKPQSQPQLLLQKPRLSQEEDIYNILSENDSDEDSNYDSEFEELIEKELRAEDISIELDDLNDIEFIDDGRNELLLDSLMGEAINLTSELSSLPTYREVLESIKKQLLSKQLNLLPRVRFEYSLIQQYVQNLLKKSPRRGPRRGRIEASLHIAESNHPTGNGLSLARKIRALFLYYRTHGSLPIETRGGKQNNRSYLDNEDVFKACRAWLLAQNLS